LKPTSSDQVPLAVDITPGTTTELGALLIYDWRFFDDTEGLVVIYG
jgi:hypothetical protein